MDAQGKIRRRRTMPTGTIDYVGNPFAAACACEDAGDWPQALRYYRRAAHGDPPHGAALFNLGTLLYRQRRKREAAEYFRLATQHEPAAPDAWNNLGLVLCELQDCQEAEHCFEQALRQSTQCIDALYNLADCLDERGFPERAANYWRRYVQQDARSEWGVYAQSRLVR